MPASDVCSVVLDLGTGFVAAVDLRAGACRDDGFALRGAAGCFSAALAAGLADAFAAGREAVFAADLAAALDVDFCAALAFAAQPGLRTCSRAWGAARRY